MPTDRQTEIEEILTAWRELQRTARDLPDGSPEAIRLRGETDRLRREYQAMVAMAAAEFRAARP